MKPESEDRITSYLSTMAAKYAKDIAEVMPASVKKYCIGYHLRNVLHCDAPAVTIKTHPNAVAQPRAKQIQEKNTESGLHTLNHVLDSLCYSSSPANRGPSKPLALCVRVTYGLENGESCHHFDAEKREDDDPGKFFNVWQGGKLRPWAQEKQLLETLLGSRFDLHYERMGVFVSPDMLRLARHGADRNIIEALFAPHGMSFNDYACGAQKLCQKMRITPSVVAYRAIMSAIFQLSTYAVGETDPGTALFGRETITLLLRPEYPFGTVAGVTIISPDTLNPEKPNGCVPLQQVVELVMGQQGQVADDPVRSKYTGDSSPFRGTGVPETLLRNIAKAARGKECWGSDFSEAVMCTTQSFLDYCARFCDEKLEGRHLRIGFLLGAAGLLRFWPGKRPLELGSVPITWRTKDPGYLSLVDLSPLTHVHLIEGPEDRAVVVPYLGKAFNEHNAPAPLKVIELADFEEALMGWSDGVLWSQEYRPYVFLTKTFRWAVGAVVGPGSHIRVFHGGRLLGYRDGKGWRRYQDPLEDDRVEKWTDACQDPGRLRSLVSAVCNAALQTSSMVREDAHGGFIVYLPTPWNDEGLKNALYEDAETEVPKTEGRVVSQGGPPTNGTRVFHGISFGKGDTPEPKQPRWVTGRYLLRAVDSGSTERVVEAGTSGESCHHEKQWALDPDVGNLIVRAAMIDGAIVLCGPDRESPDAADGYIRAFGKQVICNHELAKAEGTKARTAQSFVLTLASNLPGLSAFAVKISADGPVTLFFSPKANEVEQVELFVKEEV